MKSIFHYHSYRRFLQDVFQHEKRTAARVTLASFAKAFGLSGSTFQMILSGERNLTVTSLHSVARALDLTPNERTFFEALVLAEQTSDSETKAYYRERMVTMRGTAGVNHVRISNRKMLTPLGPALLLYLLDFLQVGTQSEIKDLDQKAIAKVFGVSAAEIASHLKVFEETGVLARAPNGGFHIVFRKVAHRLCEKDYLLSEARALVEKVSTDFDSRQSFFRAFTLSMARTDVAALRTDMIRLLEKYMAKEIKPGNDPVIQKVFVGGYPVLLA